MLYYAENKSFVCLLITRVYKVVLLVFGRHRLNMFTLHTVLNYIPADPLFLWVPMTSLLAGNIHTERTAHVHTACTRTRLTKSRNVNDRHGYEHHSTLIGRPSRTVTLSRL